MLQLSHLECLDEIFMAVEKAFIPRLTASCALSLLWILCKYNKCVSDLYYVLLMKLTDYVLLPAR